MPYYTYKVLGQANPAAATTTTLYTVPAITNTIVSTITVCNQAATTATYTIAVRPYGATLLPKHYINYNAAIPALDTIGLTMGMTLNATDVISVLSSNASTSFNVFGTQITDEAPVVFLIDYLVVAGGGGSGGSNGGGGGAGGGFLTATGFMIDPGVYTVTVGGGGTAGVSAGARAGNGVDSSIVNSVSITATGGGGGGSGDSGSPNYIGATGGSGGGGASTGGTPVLAVLLLLPVKVIMAAQVQPMVHHGDLVVVVVAPVQREELLLEHHLLARAALVFHLACQELLLIMPAGAPANHGQVQVRLLH